MGADPTRRRWRAAVPWLIVAVSVAIGYQAVRPAAPIDAAGDADFSAVRAFEHVEAIAVSPHPMGSAANAEVRRYLITTLDSLGIHTDLQTVRVPDYFAADYTGDKLVDVVNVTARIPGTGSSGTIALVAHYDTVPATPGANDNTVAVAALLETARALTTGPAPSNDVLLIFTDAEEPAPRYGATTFVAELPADHDIALAVNLEASGGSGASLLAEINGPESWLIGELAQIDAKPAAISALTALTRLFGDIGTDFDEFRNAGIPGFHFAYLHNSSIYHTERDNLAAVDLGSLQHHGDHALGIARHFGELDLRDLPEDEAAVYFPAWPFFVRYSSMWAIALAALAAIGYGAAIAGNHRLRMLASSPRRVGKSAGVFLGTIVAGTIAWMIATTLRSSIGVTEGYVYFTIVVATGSIVIARFRPRTSDGYKARTVLPWLVLAAITALFAVGFSYVFTWPAFAAAVALWLNGDGPVQENVRFAIVSLATLVVTVPVIDVLLQMAHPRLGNPDSSMTLAVVLPLLLAILVASLLRSFWPELSPSEAPPPPPK